MPSCVTTLQQHPQGQPGWLPASLRQPLLTPYPRQQYPLRWPPWRLASQADGEVTDTNSASQAAGGGTQQKLVCSSDAQRRRVSSQLSRSRADLNQEAHRVESAQPQRQRAPVIRVRAHPDIWYLEDRNTDREDQERQETLKVSTGAKSASPQSVSVRACKRTPLAACGQPCWQHPAAAALRGHPYVCCMHDVQWNVQ